jgi:hypothetical protein
MSTPKEKRPTSPLTETALRNLIQTATTKGYVRETPHAENDHPERNLSIDDVIYGLERKDWVLAQAPNYDTEHENWEYLIKTVDVEGCELHIKLAAYPGDKRVAIITRW